MAVVVVVGAQWGDEGKGKITDFLAGQANVVARYQGGNNAGHTVVVNDRVYKLHLIPSGILYPETDCMIGNGVVLDLEVLSQEIDYLAKLNVDLTKLKISDKAHVIMPYHKDIDRLEESRRASKIGTTGRGIGPAYVDKIARCGIRVGDLLDKAYAMKLIDTNLQEKNSLLEKLHSNSSYTAEDVYEQISPFVLKIKDMVTDVSLSLNNNIQDDKKILCEGAQGTLLDIDHGTYPFVTSSNPTSGGVSPGLGIGPTKIDKVVGVVKAYTTRVGEGPFPTELLDDIGEKIRERGHEYGTTTGRTRRCGWFDAVIGRYAVRINGLTGIALMLLDVLDEFETIKVCTGYSYNGVLRHEFSANLEVLAKCQPIYEELPGWQADISNIKFYDELPQNAKNYIKFISKEINCPVNYVSVGPERNQTIVVDSVF